MLIPENTKVHIGVEDEDSTATEPTQADSTTQTNTNPARNLAGRIGKLVFFTHLIAVSILISYLSIRGFLAHKASFRPARFYLPLVTSTAISSIAAAAWLLLTLCLPSAALRASLYLSPVLTILAGFLLLDAGGGAALAFGAPTIALAFVQSLYACWIAPRLHHAGQILSASIQLTRFARSAAAVCVAADLAAGVVYSLLFTLGVGGIASAAPGFSPLYIAALLLSLAWTSHVLRNISHVAISRVAYFRLARGENLDAGAAFHGAVTASLGNVCIGSAVSPSVTAVRGAARAVRHLAGGSDEFLFSFTSCFEGVADRLVPQANRWGFVHVGAHGKGFSRASRDTWEMFVRRGMVRLIDLDVTGSFCFLSGVAGGALAALVAGLWALAVKAAYITSVTVYSFIIGYFITRIAMSWPQACVSAYHVAYAEDPENLRLGSIIPDRVREL